MVPIFYSSFDEKSHKKQSAHFGLNFSKYNEQEKIQKVEG